MILLTTPDYLPKLGGLTSHTRNVEKVLTSLGLPYELFHWKSYRDVVTFDRGRLSKYDVIINIHSGFHMFMPASSARVINFVNGAEILFYSPNKLKHLLKLLLRRRCLGRVESAWMNIFISEFTFRTLTAKGLVPDFSRDIICHMVVDTTGHELELKNWNDDPLRFICVARDVPHKNFAGVIEFCETLKEISGRKIELHTITNREFHSEKIRVVSHVSPDNKRRDELLKSAHVNLLLSLDHSARGYFEGFGQIVQEAGSLGTPSLVLSTGGLPESVHHQETGWVLPAVNRKEITDWWDTMTADVYAEVSRKCYRHTVGSHGLHIWENLFRLLKEPS